MKPRRDLTRLYRQQPTWRWSPDSWAERLDAWLWEHPWAHTILMSVLLTLLFGAFLWCVLGDGS